MSDIISDLTSGVMLGSARGRKPIPLALQVVRPLNGADMAILMNPPELGVSAPPLMKLRDAHHFVARLLAEGRRPVEVALITGRCQSNISILQNDPAFKELIEVYRTEKNAVYLDVHQRLATLGLTAVAELQERLEDKPESFTNPQLLDLVTETMDRTEAPPKGGAGAKGGSGQPLPALRIEFVGAPPAGSSVVVDGAAIEVGPDGSAGE